MNSLAVGFNRIVLVSDWYITNRSAANQGNHHGKTHRLLDLTVLFSLARPATSRGNRHGRTHCLSDYVIVRDW